ncbi:MAG: methyltransferase domain-containing protein, partial [Myxococcota bacterium]
GELLRVQRGAPSHGSGVSMETTDAAACCAAFYEQDWVRALMGDHFHPGGEALTRRLVDDLALQPGDRVLDLACGTGTTALLLGAGWDVEVIGLDASASNVARATVRAADLGSVAFVEGRAHAVPLADAQFDAVLVECAVSTFADKPAVANEIVRVLKPGGRLAISDMAVYGALPDDLAAFGQGWACVDDALTMEGYRDLFVSAGLRVEVEEDESASLDAMVLELKKKLLLAGLGDASGLFEGLQTDLPTLRALLAKAKEVVKAGRVRYGRLAFVRGTPRAPGPSARACDPSTGCC